MNLIDELDGKIHKLWRFWSVRWGLISAACSGTVAAYAGFKQIDPALVAYVPQWTMSACSAGAVASTFASIIARGLKQPPADVPPTDAEDHP
jgi:hypothetical protein